MKSAYLAIVATLSMFAVGCSGSVPDVVPVDPDKSGTTITVGGTDKSKPWLIMKCTPQADGTFNFTVEGDHLSDASVQLGAGVLPISPDGKLSPSSPLKAKKEELVTFAYRLADGSSQRVDFKGCTKQ